MALGAVNGNPLNLSDINGEGDLPIALGAAAVVQANATSASAGVAANNGASTHTAQTHTLDGRPASHLAPNVENWVLGRGGSPFSMGSATGTVITDDPDFGTCLALNNWKTAGQNIMVRWPIPARPGNVYRVRARFKLDTLPSDGSTTFNIVLPGMDAAYSNFATTFGFTALTADQTGVVYEVEQTFADTTNGPIQAWPAGSVWLRPGLRLNQTEVAEIALRIESITVEVLAGEINEGFNVAQGGGTHTQDAHTFTADALAIAGASASITEADGGTAGDGDGFIVAGATLTEASDTLTGAAKLNDLAGTVNYTQAPHTFAGTASTGVGAVSSKVQEWHTLAGDAFSAVGAVLAQTTGSSLVSTTAAAIQALLDAVEAGDVLLADAEIEATKAFLAFTQDAQTLAATARADVAALLDAIVTLNASAGDGVVDIVGAGDALDADDTLLATFHQILAKKVVGASVARHGQTSTLTPHGAGSTITEH